MSWPSMWNGWQLHTSKSRGEEPMSAPFDSIEEALKEIRAGRTVAVVDDRAREDEGDLVMAAETATPEAINFMTRRGRGLVCVALTGERLDALQLPLMVAENTSRHGTAFAVSVEVKDGTTTGISVHDRA